MLYYYKDIYLYYLLLNQLDLKTLVLVQSNQPFSKNLTITTKFFLRGLHIVNCTAKLFSYQAKNVKNGENNLKFWRIHHNIYFLLVELIMEKGFGLWE